MRTDLVHAGGAYMRHQIPHLRGHIPYQPFASQRIIVTARQNKESQVVPFSDPAFSPEQHSHFKRIILRDTK